MNLKNFFTLTIRAEDFNLAAKKPVLLKQLRKLTLHPYSGLNHELNSLLKVIQIREVRAKILMAFRKKELVGWALMSREPSDFWFAKGQGFKEGDGVLFQVFVNHAHRRQGIASEILKVARRKAGPYRLCICPWDEQSQSFYSKFPNYKKKEL